MNKLQFQIARFLALKASRGDRTTYQQLGEAVGWKHPNGRGLGSNLEVILRYVHEQGYPPLTTILVKKGERYPAEDAMEYVNSVIGDIDLDEAQESVFAYDWNSVPELRPEPGEFERKGILRKPRGRFSPEGAEIEGNVFLLKFNGALHGPDNISRPRKPEQWNNKILTMPWETVRASSYSDRTPGPRVEKGDLLYLWSHEDEEFGSGFGLTGTALADAVNEVDGRLDIRLSDFDLLNHPFGFRSIAKHTWNSTILDRIKQDRTPRAWIMSPQEQAEIESVISQFGSKKAAAIADAEEAYLSPLDRLLRDQADLIAAAEEERRTTISKARPGQQKFRRGAMDRHQGRCVVTRFSVAAVLEAAHVIPHTGDPALDVPENSLVLRRDLHALFDAGLFGIDPGSSKLVISPELEATAYRKLEGRLIEHKLAPESLRYQHNRFKKISCHAELD